MGRSRCLWLSALFLLTRVALAQTVVEDNRSVASDSPEGWAMRYFAGTTLMTSFGEAARLPPWRWNTAVDVGNIPRLSDAQQRVAFGGSKSDDLNKSPVFGRLRLAVGLPDAWVAELGYTPPLEIAGSRARNVFAMAIGRRVIEGDAMSLSLRALGQVGKVRGDITCPASVAGNPDPIVNPFDCRAPPSNDTFTTNYYGVDATIGWVRKLDGAERHSKEVAAAMEVARLAVAAGERERQEQEASGEARRHRASPRAWCARSGRAAH